MALALMNNVEPLRDTLTGPTRDALGEKSGELIQVKAGQKLFEENSQANGFYLIKSGAIKLTVNRKLLRGRASTPEYLLKVAGPGEFVGFKALMRGTKQTFTALAATEATVQFYKSTGAPGISYVNENLQQEVLKQAMKDLEAFETSSQLNYLASVQERISYQIYLLAKKFGVQTADGIQLAVKLSRNELAQLAGTINESLSRHLTELKTSGVLILRGREVIVKNMPELVFRAGNFIG
jgi:CRP-like cAMP-binding protein